MHLKGMISVNPDTCIFPYMHAKLLQSYLTLCDPMDCGPPGSSVRGDSRGKNTRVGCSALLQEIIPTQGPNSCLLYLLHWQLGSLPLVPPGKPSIHRKALSSLTWDVWFPVKVKVTQLCSILSDPMGHIVHGILWARILEWVAFPFSRRSSQPRD